PAANRWSREARNGFWVAGQARLSVFILNFDNQTVFKITENPPDFLIVQCLAWSRSSGEPLVARSAKRFLGCGPSPP
ncbi:MAG: hypothetical protein PHV82_15685, partial [Victivallaceae bacterium]|nr:hypothetical protein [Victivallaceae bacterium]